MLLLDKEIFKKVFSISLPAMAGFVGLILFDIVDIYWIEKLGTKAVAGVASAGFIVWALYSFMQVTGSGYYYSLHSGKNSSGLAAGLQV
jgi:Na+-driven multidrug efflux pump